MEKKALKSFGSEAEVEAVVRGFESCATAPSEFGHREHLAVALCYLARSDTPAALERVRSGIDRFLRRYGEDPAGVYNETVTLFWLRRVRGVLESLPPGAPLDERANALLSACGDSKVIYDYYSRERLSSEEARASWAAPDLRPLDF